MIQYMSYVLFEFIYIQIPQTSTGANTGQHCVHHAGPLIWKKQSIKFVEELAYVLTKSSYHDVYQGFDVEQLLLAASLPSCTHGFEAYVWTSF